MKTFRNIINHFFIRLKFTQSPLFYNEVLFQQHHLLGLYKLSCLYLVEIYYRIMPKCRYLILINNTVTPIDIPTNPKKMIIYDEIFVPDFSTDIFGFFGL